MITQILLWEWNTDSLLESKKGERFTPSTHEQRYLPALPIVSLRSWALKPDLALTPWGVADCPHSPALNVQKITTLTLVDTLTT